MVRGSTSAAVRPGPLVARYVAVLNVLFKPVCMELPLPGNATNVAVPDV
jgi:hypothetical protein